MGEQLRKVVQTRAGGRVERCHGIVHHGSYSVAAHSWGVAMLLHALWPADFSRLALYCLAHDVPEAWVGDIPAPTKRYGSMSIDYMETAILQNLDLPTCSDMSLEDRQKIKNCDQLELYIWSLEQGALGNMFASEVCRELDQFWRETPLLPEAARLLVSIQERGVMPRVSGIIRELVVGGVAT